MAMYVRVKRQSRTMFVHVEAEDTIAAVLHEVASVEEQAVENIRLLAPSGTVLKDTDRISSCAENNGVLMLVHRTEDGWEDIDVRIPVYEGDAAPMASIALPEPLVEYLDEMNPSENPATRS